MPGGGRLSRRTQRRLATQCYSILLRSFLCDRAKAFPTCCFCVRTDDFNGIFNPLCLLSDIEVLSLFQSDVC